ncbi:hypothetical protein HZU38_18895 [Mycolicibacterium vanbaalenii]|uniref:hypothetical protein n=1 Tax=Mycolicibacterium vanbaalenii TaxID=110539 RepID=UPI001F2245D1|nr:hypothetical protein [Mycolicibacterium vanbaalenii]UJL27011.1 hypothetical protein HZU38_18895 [Mycolicibacterium vanbaalenii]WND59134.1 hypothetical protein QQA43_12500 [Mycolicibacterium vanbaalenii]
MRIRNGHTAEVYRPSRDRHGDTTTETHIGDIENCFLDPVSQRADDDYSENTSITTVLWYPAGADIHQRDRIIIDGNTFRVVSVTLNHPHPVTGYSFGYARADLHAIV